jgi:hypothetical protein
MLPVAPHLLVCLMVDQAFAKHKGYSLACRKWKGQYSNEQEYFTASAAGLLSASSGLLPETPA